MILPSGIIIQSDSGTGNMGDVSAIGTQSSTTGRVARFYLEGPFSLAWIRAHFSRPAGGSTNGTASLHLKIDSRLGPAHDHTLMTWTGAGITAAVGDSDVHERIPEDELFHYTFAAGDELCFEWTNPSATNVLWGIEVGLLDAARTQ